jgi:hypothetical protein
MSHQFSLFRSTTSTSAAVYNIYLIATSYP